MDFIKTLAKNKPGRVPSDGCVILSHGQLNVKIKTRTHDVSQVGIIDGGIGCILTERKKERQTETANATRPVSDGDIPANLMSEGIDFVFRVKNCQILNMYSCLIRPTCLISRYKKRGKGK